MCCPVQYVLDAAACMASSATFWGILLRAVSGCCYNNGGLRNSCCAPLGRRIQPSYVRFRVVPAHPLVDPFRSVSDRSPSDKVATGRGGQAIVHQDRGPVDRRGDHESGITGGRYRNRRQRVSQPQPTDRNAQLTWCWCRTPWGTSAKFRERQWQIAVQSRTSAPLPISLHYS